MKKLNKVVKSGKGATKPRVKAEIKETKKQSNNTLQEKQKKARIAEIEKQIAETEKEIKRLKKELNAKEQENKADANEFDGLTKKQQKVFDEVAEHLSKKLFSLKDFTNAEIKTMFLYCIYNDKRNNDRIKAIVEVLSNIAYKQKPAIDENFKIIAKKIKDIESKI